MLVPIVTQIVLDWIWPVDVILLVVVARRLTIIGSI